MISPWWIIIAVIIGAVIILFLKIELAVKIASLLAWITIFVAGYTMYVNIQIRDRQTMGIELGQIEGLWSGIHQTFTQNASLTEFYRKVYNSPNPAIDPILQMMAESIEILILDSKIIYPESLLHAMQQEWIRRIVPWISTPEFQLFWQNNKQFYLPETNRLISRIQALTNQE